MPGLTGGSRQTININTSGGSNGLGVAGLVLALLGVFLCWIPVLGWVLWLLGLIFSFVGLFRRPRGCAIAGFVISFIDLIILIAIGATIGAAIAGLFSGLG